MSSSDKNLSDFNASLPRLFGVKIGIVVAEWNNEVTDALFAGCYKTLVKSGLTQNEIKVVRVPGSFELILGSQKMAAQKDIDAVIALGCVIQGETRHFDFICQAVATGIADINLKFDKPVIFGVLTPENQQQALDRAGGIHGNKGEEAAYTVLRMLEEFR